MRLLLNVAEEDKRFLGMYTALLKNHGHQALMSSSVYEATDLVKIARDKYCDAIVVSNTLSLHKITNRPPVGTSKGATLDEYRGSRFNYDIPIYVINPLEHLVTVPSGRWLLERDIEKIKTCKTKIIPFEWKLADHPDTFSHIISRAHKAIVIAFDIETKPAYNMITCVSYAMLFEDGKIETWVIPLYDFDRRHYNVQCDFEAALQTIQIINKMPTTKAAHNGIYDCTYSITYNAEPSHYLFDTMFFGWSRFSELSQSLDFNASLYLYDYCQWKHEASDASNKKDIVSYWAYCARDSWSTLRIMVQQLMLSQASDYWIHNYKRTFRLTFPSIYCAFEGCKIDTIKRRELLDQAIEKATKIRDDFRIYTGYKEYNPGSSKQVSQFFYDLLGAKRPKSKTKTATGEKELNQVAIQHPLFARLVKEHLDFKEVQKQASTYYDFYLHGDRALWTVRPTGTETGRLASSKSAFGLWDTEAESGKEWQSYGLQVQNIPQTGVKCIFLPDEGYILFEIDKSKSEARIVGYMSKCWKMVEALEDTGKDFYKQLYSMLFGVPYESVTKYQRDKIMKRIIHGSNYLMGAMTFIVVVTPQELFKIMQELGKKMELKAFATWLLSLYHNPFPELKLWYQEVLNEVKYSGGFLVSPLGWTRRVFGSISGSSAHQTLRSIVAHKPQNLSVDLLNDDWWESYLLTIESRGNLRIKGQIHDSIFGQIKIEHMNYYLPILLNRQQPVTINGRTMVIPSECKISYKNWQDMEEWKDGTARE
jgi:DNA polymerase I-like protein with 3'-5' exonuclease and polymerase domains